VATLYLVRVLSELSPWITLGSGSDGVIPMSDLFSTSDSGGNRQCNRCFSWNQWSPDLHYSI